MFGITISLRRSISAKIPGYLPFCCVSKQSRNTLRILNALVCSYPSGRTLIKSMCVGLFSICLYACLSCRVTIFLSGRELFCNSHRPCVALYLLPSTKTFLSMYFKFHRSIVKELSVSSWHTPKVGSCDTLLLITLWIYFGFIDHRHRFDCDCAVSVLNTGTEPIIRLRFRFFWKLDLVSVVPPVSTMGVEMCSRIRFQVFRYGSWWRGTCLLLL